MILLDPHIFAYEFEIFYLANEKFDIANFANKFIRWENFGSGDWFLFLVF